MSSVGDLFVWLARPVDKLAGHRIWSVKQNREQQREHFKLLLKGRTPISKTWFLASLVEQFISNGILLNENEVYGFKIFPALGGDYSPR